MPPRPSRAVMTRGSAPSLKLLSKRLGDTFKISASAAAALEVKVSPIKAGLLGVLSQA